MDFSYWFKQHIIIYQDKHNHNINITSLAVIAVIHHSDYIMPLKIAKIIHSGVLLFPTVENETN